MLLKLIRLGVDFAAAVAQNHVDDVRLRKENRELRRKLEVIGIAAKERLDPYTLASWEWSPELAAVVVLRSHYDETWGKTAHEPAPKPAPTFLPGPGDTYGLWLQPKDPKELITEVKLEEPAPAAMNLPSGWLLIRGWVNEARTAFRYVETVWYADGCVEHNVKPGQDL